MINCYSDFVQANRELWDKIPTREDTNGLLLVEPQRHPIISHANAVFARVIKEAKGLSIGWIDSGDPEIQERLMSYDSTSHVLASRLTVFGKLILAIRFVWSALKILLTGDIIGFSLDGIPFGELLYDSYLARYKVATIRKVNKGVLRTLLSLLYHYLCTKKMLKDTRASCVLVSHQVGLSSGVLFRSALALGAEVYLRTGGGSENGMIDCNRFTSLEEIYNYPSRPRECDIEYLLAVGRRSIEKQFNELMNERMAIGTDKDARLAYHPDKVIYTSREKFASDFNITPQKKNIFVMLHAFNDHPHSHFGPLLFKDYYDWFVQTLEAAKKIPDVNWIFKEHPSSKYYPTKDLCLEDCFETCPDHIVFLSAESSFNSKSLVSIADGVVTVLGTAGVEFPAANGIPSLLAGHTPYSGFGFTIEPSTKEEYFQVLENIQEIEKLTKEQEYMAKVVFLYIQKYSHVPFDWAPVVSYDETKSSDLDAYYWNLVVRQYQDKPDILMQQFNNYVRPISQADFSRLSIRD